MDIILSEAKKRGMKVWLLDDDKFPTGHAAGLIASKYPDLRQWNVAERHIDICGPMKDGAVLASATDTSIFFSVPLLTAADTITTRYASLKQSISRQT